MELKLEQLEYQQQAINAVMSVFKGQEKNTFDNACIEGIRSNILSLSSEEIIQNLQDISLENGIKEETANIQPTNDIGPLPTSFLCSFPHYPSDVKW